MRLKNFLSKIIATVVIVFGMISCDDDFNTVGGEIIGPPNFQDRTYSASPIAYNHVLDRVQTSRLPGNLLGVYNDPNFGNITTTYSVLSQIGLPGNSSPSYPTGAKLKSVVLDLPYFSTTTGIEQEEVESNSSGGMVTETKTMYRLDSIYGNTQDSIKLSIFKSNYFLTDFGSMPDERRIYYSDDIVSFGSEVEAIELYNINNFVPSEEEVVLRTEEVDNDGVTQYTRERLSPRLRVVFPDEVTKLFQSLFIDKEGDPEFSNANNFRNFFRGIYFKAEAVDNKTKLVYFNIGNANITLNYSFDQEETTVDLNGDGDTDDTVEEDGQLVLNFSNNIINGIQNSMPIGDIVTNNDNLYVKGGQGSYAVLDFFNRVVETDENNEFVTDSNGNPIFVENPDPNSENNKTELDFLKSQEWLIKDATIKLYVNRDELSASGDTEPERIYIFNQMTGTKLADYCFDPSLNPRSPVNSVISHLSRLQRDSDDNGEFYQIKITRHIIGILNGDTDNVKLGVSVSQNVNIESLSTNNANCSDVLPADVNDDNDVVPFSSVISHEGTILYGNTPNIPELKRLKLEISYTRSKNE